MRSADSPISCTVYSVRTEKVSRPRDRIPGLRPTVRRVFFLPCARSFFYFLFFFYTELARSRLDSPKNVGTWRWSARPGERGESEINHRVILDPRDRRVDRVICVFVFYCFVRPALNRYRRCTRLCCGRAIPVRQNALSVLKKPKIGGENGVNEGWKKRLFVTNRSPGKHCKRSRGNPRDRQPCRIRRYEFPSVTPKLVYIRSRTESIGKADKTYFFFFFLNRGMKINYYNVKLKNLFYPQTIVSKVIGLFRHIFPIISRRSFSKRQPVSFILICRYLNDGITGENHALSFEFSSRTLAFYTSSNRISNNVKSNNYEQLMIFEGPDVLFASIQQNRCDYC